MILHFGMIDKGRYVHAIEGKASSARNKGMCTVKPGAGTWDRHYTAATCPRCLKELAKRGLTAAGVPVPTQEWIDKSQGLTGLAYDANGERLSERTQEDNRE